MGKKYILLVVGVMSLLTLSSCMENKNSPDETPVILTDEISSVPDDEVVEDISGENISSPINTSYEIGGEIIALVNGKNEGVTVFSYDTRADINEDGREDNIVLLMKDLGGSGIFFYVAVAIDSDNGFTGSNAIFLGDRIAPQNMEVKDGKVIVNYSKRRPWESFGDQASVEASKYLIFNNGVLEEQIGEELSQEVAQALTVENIGDCSENDCEDFEVNILDGQDGIWYIEVILDGLRDDSLKAIKRVYTAHFVNEKWEFGEENLKEFKCQEGRGSQDFSPNFCM